MNAIELLSVQYNFSVEDAVNILTMNNKKSRSKAKVVEPKREVEDLFAQLVNDAEDTFDVAVKEALDKNPIRSVDEENDLHKRNEIVLKSVAESLNITESTEPTDKKKTKKTVMTAEEKEAAAEAKKQEKLAAAEAKKLAKEQEKLAKEEAKKAAAEAKKAEKKAPKAKAAKSEPKVETKVEAKVEEAPVKVTVKRIKIGGQEYLKSSANILYNPATQEEVGMYDEATNSIKPLPDDDDDEELEEDNYSM